MALFACHPYGYFYRNDELFLCVVKIQLIEYANSDAKLLKTKNGRISYGVLPFNFELMEILDELAIEQHAALLSEVADVEIMEFEKHVDSPSGKALLLTYDTGMFDVISSGIVSGERQRSFVARYHQDGTLCRYIGGVASPSEINKISLAYFGVEVLI
jgi:hypothetical protein